MVLWVGRRVSKIGWRKRSILSSLSKISLSWLKVSSWGRASLKGERKKKKGEKDRDMSNLKDNLKDNIGTDYLNPKCMWKRVPKIGWRRRRKRKIFLSVRSVCVNQKWVYEEEGSKDWKEEEEEEKTLVNRFLRLTPDLVYCSTGGELYTQNNFASQFLLHCRHCIQSFWINSASFKFPLILFLSLKLLFVETCIGASQICAQLPLNHIRLFQIDSRKTSGKFDPKTNSSYRQKWMFFVIFSKSCQYFSQWPQGSRNSHIFLKIC